MASCYIARQYNNIQLSISCYIINKETELAYNYINTHKYTHIHTHTRARVHKNTYTRTCTHSHTNIHVILTRHIRQLASGQTSLSFLPT